MGIAGIFCILHPSQCGETDPDLVGDQVCRLNNFLRHFIQVVINAEPDLIRQAL